MTTKKLVLGQEMHDFIRKWAPKKYAEMHRDLDRLIQGAILGAEEGINHFVDPSDPLNDG